MKRNTKTSTQKFGDGVRKIADKVKGARKKVADWDVPDTVHLKQVFKNSTDENGKKVTEINWNDFATWAKEIAQFGLKGGGIATLWLAEYLTRFANVIFVDNFATRKLEVVTRKLENASKKDASIKFIKKHPWVKSYLIYYMMVGTMVTAGTQLAVNGFNKEDNKEDEKNEKEVVIDDEKDNDDNVVNTIVVVERTTMKTIDPNDANFVTKAISEYWAESIAMLTELETYRTTPKVHVGEKRATRGLGTTWEYVYDNEGVLHQKPNLKDQTKVLNKSENYEQARRHLLFETLPFLKGATKNKNNIGAQQAVALILAGYQRPSDMATIAARISVATTKQEIADAFNYCGKVPQKYRTGTLKRRWWCAAYAVGLISAEDILELPRDAFSRIEINNVYRNGHFLLGAETVKYAINKAKEGTKSDVKTFLSDFNEGEKIIKQVQAHKIDGNTVVINDLLINQDDVTEQSMAKLNQADGCLMRGEYSQAVNLYKEAISIDKDNMEAYSSLALAYKKLGDKHNSIDYYEKCLQAVKDGNERMNANKELLLDRNIKAATYYNAGSAREKMAKIYQNQGDIKSASRNYELAIKNYQTALENAQIEDSESARIQTYENAIKRVQTEKQNLSTDKSGKKVAFNAAIKQIKQKNAKHDLLLYGKEYRGNMT